MKAAPALGQYFAGQPRKAPLRLTLLLYAAVISIDGVRKLTGLSASADGIIYLIVGGMYLFLIPGISRRLRVVPRYLPVWLILFTFWCVIEALLPRIPVGIAALGWASYVFFVPLLYIGAELMADDRSAARILRVVAITGGLVGLGATVSALLGQSAPSILLPIVPSVGVHTNATGNIYLAPSVFATAEEAAEELLIALFAWIALAYLPSGKMRRTTSVTVGVLIFIGLFATERRADIAVAVIGLAALMILGRQTPRGKLDQLISSTATRPRSRTRPALALALALSAVGSIALLSFLGASKIVPFLTSGAEGESSLTFMFSPAFPDSLTGQGTGTSTQGASVLGATSFDVIRNNQSYNAYIDNGRTFITAEGGITKTWLELGIVGVVLYAGIFLSALSPAVRSLRQLDGVGRALTILTIALGVVFLKGHASLDNPLVQPLFWLCAGATWGRMRGLAAGPEQGAGTVERAAPADRYCAYPPRRPASADYI